MISAVPPTPSRRVSILTQTESLLIVKARLACKYLRNSSLRVIYAYFIHERRVDFIELYFRETKSAKTGQGLTGICESIGMAGSRKCGWTLVPRIALTPLLHTV